MAQTTEVKNNFELSFYQQDILEWVLNTPEGNGIINAVAGSGKSTTLKLIATALQDKGIDPEDMRIIVFGKQNSLDLMTKFDRRWVHSIRTLHSVGYEILTQKIRRVLKLDNLKYKKIAKRLDYLGTRKKPGSLLREGYINDESQYLKLLNLVRLNLLEPSADNLKAISRNHGLDEIYGYKECSVSILEILRLGKTLYIDDRLIDYTDMVTLPVMLAKEDYLMVAPFKFVLVDECQDLNPSQRELSLLLAGNKGRLIFAGDPKQAIYGFSGASCNSYQEIKDLISAVELPLSVCYRCPKSHIELVNRVFPDIPIKPYENAIEGIVEQVETDSIIHQENDLVISRKTAPLISYCLHLIAQGIPAKVRGRDIGKNLIKEIDNVWDYAMAVYNDNADINKFLSYIDLYQVNKISHWEDLDYKEQLIEALEDRLTCLRILFDNLKGEPFLKDLKDATKELFSESNNYVNLSTVHRAKGLESDRVFILNIEDMPMIWRDQLQWELEQENNILYVALTRSKSELYFTGDPSWENGKKRD